MEKYINYSAEQFAEDDFFNQWVLAQDPDIDKIWEKWLSRYPAKIHEVKEAKDIVLSFSTIPDKSYFQKTELELEKLFKKIDEKEQKEKTKKIIHITPRKLSIAAVFVLGILFLELFFYFNRNTSRTFTTSYNETQEIELPDGSSVILNSNSSLSYHKDWQKEEREVWIEGEALFKVRKVKSNSSFKKFVVHSSNLTVEVLGTEFDVDSRRKRTRVVLKEGSVNILDKVSNQQVLMTPGDLVEINEEGKLIKEKVKTSLYTSWKDNELLFDQTPLSEIARILEDNYGYDVIFKDPAIKKRKFTGSSKTNEIDILLTKISKSNDLKITIKNQLITIKNP